MLDLLSPPRLLGPVGTGRQPDPRRRGRPRQGAGSDHLDVGGLDIPGVGVGCSGDRGIEVTGRLEVGDEVARVVDEVALAGPVDVQDTGDRPVRAEEQLARVQVAVDTDQWCGDGCRLVRHCSDLRCACGEQIREQSDVAYRVRERPGIPGTADAADREALGQRDQRVGARHRRTGPQCLGDRRPAERLKCDDPLLLGDTDQPRHREACRRQLAVAPGHRAGAVERQDLAVQHPPADGAVDPHLDDGPSGRSVGPGPQAHRPGCGTEPVQQLAHTFRRDGRGQAGEVRVEGETPDRDLDLTSGQDEGTLRQALQVHVGDQQHLQALPVHLEGRLVHHRAAAPWPVVDAAGTGGDETATCSTRRRGQQRAFLRRREHHRFTPLRDGFGRCHLGHRHLLSGPHPADRTQRGAVWPPALSRR